MLFDMQGRQESLAVSRWCQEREWYGFGRGVVELGFLNFAYFSPTNLTEGKRQEPQFSRNLSVALGLVQLFVIE